MPPKRKSVKRKISTPVVPSAASSSEAVPAKKQKIGNKTGLEITGRTRSTRSGTQLPELSSATTIENARPLQTSNTPPVPRSIEVPTIPQVLTVPEIPKVPATQLSQTTTQNNPSITQRETTHQPLDPNATLQNPQDASKVKTTHLDQSPAPQDAPPPPPATSQRIQGTPVRRTPSRRPPVFSEAMKAEQQRLELEAEAEKERSQQESLQIDIEIMHEPSGEPQSSETSQKGTGNLMTNVLSHRPSILSADPAEEPPFDLEKYANHPLPALRQAYKDLKASEGLKASMRKEWETSQAADQLLGRSKFTSAYSLIDPRMRPSERLRRNLARDDAMQDEGDDGESEAEIESNPQPVSNASKAVVEAMEPVSTSKRTIVPVNAQSTTQRPVAEPVRRIMQQPSTGPDTIPQENAMQNQLDTESLVLNAMPSSARTTVGQAVEPSLTTLKTLVCHGNAKPVIGRPASVPAAPIALQQTLSPPNTTPHNAFAHLTPSERAAKRASLIQKLHEIQAELRLLDAETERANAGVRVNEFKNLLETHRRELEAGSRASSPYFPDYRRPASVGKGLPGKTALAGSEAVPGFLPTRNTDGTTVASQGAVSPLSRTMPAQAPDPVHQNSAPGASATSSASVDGGAFGLFQPNHELSQSQKDSLAKQKQQFIDLSARTAPAALAGSRFGLTGLSPGGYEQMLRLKHGQYSAPSGTGSLGATPQASMTQKSANGLAQTVPASTSSQLSVPPLFRNMPAQSPMLIPQTQAQAQGTASTVVQPPTATAGPPARTYGTAAQQIIARRDKEIARQDAANARAASAALKRSQALERKTLAAEKKAAKTSKRVPADTGPPYSPAMIERGLAELERILSDGISGRPTGGLLAGVSRASTGSTTPRNGASASQPSAAPGLSSRMAVQSSGSGLLRLGSGNLFSDVKAAQSQPSTTSNGALPSNKKSAIVEPPRTGAVSPYGHRLADAPETSRLLAELENLTRSGGTPVADSKPSVDFKRDVESQTSATARGGNPFSPAGMPGMLGTGLSSYSAGSPSSSSAYPSLQTGISATQPLASRPTSGLATPLASTQATSMVKGKGKAISPMKAKTPAKPKMPEEKRPARKRNTCPVAIRDRADRVREQRMYMVHRAHDDANLKETCSILGSTGNVYTVEFGRVPTCTCPDFYKGNHCKHIIFVALKVLRMSEYGDLWYQKGYLDTELRQIFAAAPPNSFDSVAAPANVQKAFREHLGLEPGPSAKKEGEVGEARDDDGKRKPAEGDECPICADEMKVDRTGLNELVYDLGAGGCGQALHKQCFQMWAAQEKTKRKQPTCVYCRHEWATTSSGTGAGPGFDMTDGYLNMAGLAGISRQRDTSSYYNGPRKGKSYRRGWGCEYDDDW